MADRSLAIRRAAATILRDMRFQVTEASSGEEALSKYGQHSPDAILIDGKLAAQDSYSYLQALAERRGKAGPKIILCTNECDPGQIVTAIGAGADEYVIKPFDRSILAAKFEQLGLTG